MKAISTLLLLAIAPPVLAVTINTGGVATANNGIYTSVSQTFTIDFNTNTYPTTGLASYQVASERRDQRNFALHPVKYDGIDRVHPARRYRE